MKKAALLDNWSILDTPTGYQVRGTCYGHPDYEDETEVTEYINHIDHETSSVETTHCMYELGPRRKWT